MLVTVAICTWNRADLLDQTLARLAEVRAGTVEWELLVVNNNCTDATDQVLSKYATQLPLRRLFEPTPGLSTARNRAVSEAQGELIVWTDDDVLVGPDWLQSYVDAASQWTDATFFGGPIAPWFSEDPPRWLVQQWRYLADAYATREFGDSPVELDIERLPFGANFAVRTNAQRQFKYDPSLGVRPGSRMGGEEVSVLGALCEQGHRGRWVPTAKVEHYIPRQRLTTAYIRGFYAGYGEFLARQAKLDSSPRLLGRPRWMWRVALEKEVRYQWERLCCSSDKWVQSLIASSIHWGKMKAYRAPAIANNQKA